jgi:aspartate racemase
MYSVDFVPIKHLQHVWTGGRRRPYISRRRHVISNRADFVVLCINTTNTMHRMADVITEAVSIPLRL